MNMPSPSSRITSRPLYLQVMEEIVALSRTKRAGERLGTEAEFVKAFGVSLVTVRQALARLEVEGLVERRRGSGTFKPDVSAQRKHVGILFEADPTHPRVSPFFMKIARDLRSELRGIGLANRTYFGTGPLHDPGEGRLTNEDLLDDAKLGRLNSVVMFYGKRHASWMDVLDECGVPFLDSQKRWEQGGTSKRHFFSEALKHLKAQGRRRVAVIGLELPGMSPRPVYQEIREAAACYGIELDERLLDLSANPGTTGMGWERFRDIWRNGPDKPDALIVIDDMMFGDCQKAILELNLAIPRDFEVVVYTSDAMELEPAFPVSIYQISTRAVVQRFCEAISAMLDERPLPSWDNATLYPRPLLTRIYPPHDDLLPLPDYETIA